MPPDSVWELTKRNQIFAPGLSPGWRLPLGCLQGGAPEEGLEGGGAERGESERPERRILPAPAAHTLYPSNVLESQLPHKIVNFLL